MSSGPSSRWRKRRQSLPGQQSHLTLVQPVGGRRAPWRPAVEYISACAVIAAIALAAFIPPAAAQGCKLSLVAEWTVREGRNHLVIDGAINGAPVGVALDTGAARSVILRSTAVRLDLPRRDARGMRLYGVGGETKVEIAQVDDLRLGAAATPGLALYVAGEIAFGGGVDVLLGHDFLSKFDVEFDLRDHKVRLFRTQDCGDTSLAYWTKDVPGQVALERLDPRNPRVAFTVEVNHARMPAILDSGAPSSILSRSYAESVGVLPDSPGVTEGRPLRGLGAKPRPSWVGTFEMFAIGNETIPDVRLRFADLYSDSAHAVTGSLIQRTAAPTQPMLLGADFLRAHRTFVAHSQQRMYFTYDGGKVFRVE